MKKLLSLVLISAITVFCVVGCGKQPTAEHPKSEHPKAEHPTQGSQPEQSTTEHPQ